MTARKIVVGYGLLGAIAVASGVLLAAAALRLRYPALAHRIMHEEMAMRLKHLFPAAAIFAASHSMTVAAGGGAGDAGPVTPTVIGINLGGIGHFSSQRAFANLAIGSSWLEAGLAPRYIDLAAASQTADGGIAFVRPGATAILPLAAPDTGPHGATIRCTWTGQGDVALTRTAMDVTRSSHSLQFHWTNNWHNSTGVDFRVTSADPKDPVRHIDCRETTTPANAVFDLTFVKELKGFKTIRFMDWQRTNGSPIETWDNRNQPSSIIYTGKDGVPVEHMMALANEVGANPWFCMSWNADADYIEHFARFVHDHLPADRKVYVETSNEVWNTAFEATRQASSEGIAEHLSTNPGLAGLYRYAEKTTAVMKIWSQVFADRPHSLVRVAASQQDVPFKSETVLGFRDTAAHLDALATAAYFGDIMHEGMTDNLDEAFARLNKRVDQTIAGSVQNKAVAHEFGKMYVTYEAGQAVVIPYNMPFLASIERDPRMYGIYRKFLSAWRSQVGGSLNLFNNVGDIRFSGAWGLLEHSGQPLSEAPKMRAVVDDRAANP